MCSTKVVEKALRAGEKLFLCVATTTKNSETKLKIGETYFRPVLQEFADVLAEELHQLELIPSIANVFAEGQWTIKLSLFQVACHHQRHPTKWITLNYKS